MQDISPPVLPKPAASKTGQMIGLARRGWWLSALAVALDGISAIVAVVSGTVALLSVLFMDVALPSATSLGLIFLSTVPSRLDLPPCSHLLAFLSLHISLRSFLNMLFGCSLHTHRAVNPDNSAFLTRWM